MGQGETDNIKRLITVLREERMDIGEVRLGKLGFRKTFWKSDALEIFFKIIVLLFLIKCHLTF